MGVWFGGLGEFCGGEDVVGDLRHEPPRVDRVRGRKRDAVRGGLGVDLRIGEDALDGRLRVVEVAANADGVHVRVGGRRHLEALDLRGTRRRIEDDDLRALDARKALHRGRARVARRRRQDEDALAVRRVLHEDRQHRERDVLERARPAMEELKDVEAVLLDKRNRIARRKTRAEPIDRRRAHIRRQVVEERAENEILGRAQGHGVFDSRDLADRRRHIQPAVRRQSLKDGLGACRRETLPCRNVLHANTPFCFWVRIIPKSRPSNVHPADDALSRDPNLTATTGRRQAACHPPRPACRSLCAGRSRGRTPSASSPRRPRRRTGGTRFP